MCSNFKRRELWRGLCIEPQDKKEYLLSQENFERLMNVQKIIEQTTEMRPTFKKLINSLVTDEALIEVTQRLIKQMT